MSEIDQDYMEQVIGCYACEIAGVWTGPESHSPGCRMANTPMPAEPVTHRIYTEYSGECAHWECSCGRGGSSDADRVDLASDKHIAPGEGRTDTSRPF